MTDSSGDVIGLVVCAVIAVVFLLMAWKMWHGQWLNLIAGNNFVTKEEMKTSEQRQLGRGVALIMALCGFAAVVLAVAACGEMLAFKEAGADAFLNGCFVVAGVLFAASMVFLAYMMLKGSRERKRENLRRIEEAEASGNAREKSKVEADVHLESKQGRVVTVIVGAMVLIYVFLALFAAQSN